MFRGGQVNPYDDIVVKATDENQTSENWEILLNLCDKVAEEGEQGARNVIAALLKRLTHRNANVQLYALSVAEALSKNCDITVHREMASKAFTQGLEKLATDRNGHDKVKKRTLGLIKLWAGEFAHDPQLGLMEECYSSLKAKGMRFEDMHETPAPTYDDEAARREEEELQRVLEMSKTEVGGRNRWNDYSSYGAAGASGSGSQNGGSASGATGAGAGAGGGPAYTPAAQPAVASSSRQQTIPPQAQTPAPAPVAATPIPAQAPPPAATPVYTPAPAAAVNPASPVIDATPLDPSTLQIVKRVRALHDFAATEVGELSFKKGDVIKVVDRCFKDWWRGQMKGRTGIFPVNYVEPLPEPTAAELAKEAEAESLVFSQGGAIDTLLQKLREFDPAAENLNDNEEIQELYRSSMSLRPKILKLIDKYSQKKAELVVMNERYVKARNTFERMMEESVAKHNPSAAVYDYSQPPAGQDQYGQAGNRATAYGWNPNLYGQGAGVLQPGAQQGAPDAAAYAYQQSQQYQHQQPATNVPQEYPPQPYAGYPQQGQGQQGQGQEQQYVAQYGYAGYQQPQPGQEQQPQGQGQAQYPQPYQQQGQPQQQQPQQPQQGQQQYQPQQPQAQQSQAQLQHSYSYGGGGEAQPQGQAQPQPQPQAQQQPQQHQPEPVQSQQSLPGYGQPQAHDAQAQQPQAYDPQAQQPQAYDPQAQQPQAYDPQAQQPQAYDPHAQQQQQHQAYSQPAEGQGLPGYQQPAQAQTQPQAQGQPQQQQGYQQSADQAQHQPQPAAEQQPQQQPQEATPTADQGPPYLWNGTNKYPNPGACQWAEYYLGGGDDLSGLVYFMGPDGNVLTGVPPKEGFGAQMQAMQQGFAQVGLT